MLAHGPEALPPGTGVLWSLAVEEHFYLLFPLLYLILRRATPDPRRQVLALWALCGAFLAWRFVLVFGLRASSDHLAIATDARFDSIMFGCALATWGNPALDPTRFSKRVWTLVLFPSGLALLALSQAIPSPVRDAVKQTVQGIALVPIFCAAVRYPDWGPLRLLNARPVVFLGVLSYSFYLVHNVLIQFIQAHMARRDGVYHAAAFAASFLAAWAMYLFIERPSNRLRHRLPAAKPSARSDHKVLSAEIEV